MGGKESRDWRGVLGRKSGENGEKGKWRLFLK